MSTNASLPKPKVEGAGRVLYRCAACGKMGEPDQFMLIDDKSYHAIPCDVPRRKPNGR